MSLPWFEPISEAQRYSSRELSNATGIPKHERENYSQSPESTRQLSGVVQKMVLRVEVLSLADTDSGRRSAIIRRHKFSESKVGGLPAS
jgi:hypothetical protein